MRTYDRTYEDSRSLASGSEALAASQVKIAGRDVLATWKILVTLGVTPVLYSFYAILAAVVATKAGVPLKWRIWTPFIILMILPMVGYAALKFGEAGMDVLKYAFSYPTCACF